MQSFKQIHYLHTRIYNLFYIFIFIMCFIILNSYYVYLCVIFFFYLLFYFSFHYLLFQFKEA